MDETDAYFPHSSSEMTHVRTGRSVFLDSFCELNKFGVEKEINAHPKRINSLVSFERCAEDWPFYSRIGPFLFSLDNLTNSKRF